MLQRISTIQSDDRVLNQFQDQVSRKLNPVFSNPLLDGVLIQGVSLANGDTTINHMLGRTLIGWFLTRRSGAATVYDKQSTNSTSNLTLVLNSSAAITADIYVF